MSELWAKSPASDGRQLPLLLHTEQVVAAAAHLFGMPAAPTRLGEAWLRFFKIETSAFALFAKTLRAAAALHDLGKANEGFQDAVSRRGDQVIRHEHFSALVIFHPLCWEWVNSQEGVDWDVVLVAVLTHHLQAAERDLIPPLTPGRKYVVCHAGKEFDDLAAGIQCVLGITGKWPSFPAVWTFERAGTGEKIQSHVSRLKDHLEESFGEASDQRKRLLWAVRAALIASDAAASGLFREDRDMIPWIEERFAQLAPLTARYIREEIIEERIKQLGDRWAGWHVFQDAAAMQPSRTLLLAPCGSGKTLAAWRWIEEQIRKTAERGLKQVIFLYPTRATATEGFKDYVAWAPGGDAALIHGTAAYELDGMFDNPREPSDPRKEKTFRADPRLFALGFWGKRVFSGTVDQFLAFLQYGYGSLCLLPLLADSVVVIDEVHSFDEKMFAALKTFLDEFDVPVLCMTASLSKQRRGELHRCGLTEYADKPDDLKKIADAPRYSVKRLQDRQAAAAVASNALNRKLRVLWVVNKVRVAQELARQFGAVATTGGLQTEAGAPVLCYHSRFILDDRKRWHGCVVDAFKRKQADPPRAILAVTTQVCEMSLDLDADVLITEESPITSLIQRMGRCNRKAGVPTSVGEVYVYPPDDQRPYAREDWIGVEAFLAELSGRGAVGQSHLESALERLGCKAPQGDRLIQFVVSGPYADGREEDFRDIDDFANPGVLDEHAYLQTSRVRRPGLIVPVPKHLQERRGVGRDTCRLVIAKAGHYHQHLGLCDELIGE
jgi:CRISPR-associated endonuclease/helicase Cas3